MIDQKYKFWLRDSTFRTDLRLRAKKIFGLNSKNVQHEDTDFDSLYAGLASSINASFHEVYKSRPSDPVLEDENDEQEAIEVENADAKQSAPQQPDLFNVDDIVIRTRENFQEAFSDLLAGQMSRGVLRQIEQQYRANTAYERVFDTALTGLRWFAAWIFLAAIPIIIGIFFILVGESWLMLSKSWGFMLSSLAGVEIGSKEKLASLYGTILSMLDMMLISALVMMVTIGGYENTVSRIGLKHAYPRWFGKLDIGSLKIKVAQSIATISAIHLLLNFMMIDTNDGQDFKPEVIMWTAIVHVVFVVSALILAYVNKFSHADDSPHTYVHRERKTTGTNPDKSSIATDVSA